MHAMVISVAPLVMAQTPGSVTTEVHPSFTTYDCTTAGCAASARAVVLDQNWRWIHNADGYDNCFDGNWDSTYCPDAEMCAANCVIEGISSSDYLDTYGVSTSSDVLTLDYVTTSKTGGKSVGSRTFLLNEAQTEYEVFYLKNKEFSFDVDVSSLGCGLNGALYFTSMDADGGSSRFASNTAGAKYGTGYCDAQSPRDLHYIDGMPNVADWSSSTSTGKYGSSCAEMDVWEANALAEALTPHTCGDTQTQTRCEGESGCSGHCDEAGCDFNPYRLGNTTFYGKGSSYALDTTKAMTVVTQFITADGTDTGELSEIRRFYKQGSVTIQQPTMAVNGKGSFSSISDAYCEAEASWFSSGQMAFEGMAKMGQALSDGMVLVLSIWDDYATSMNWLDSTSPTGSTAPGAKRGPCSTDAGNPDTTRTEDASASVAFSNIRFGPIGTTQLDVTSTSQGVEAASGEGAAELLDQPQPSPAPHDDRL